MTNDKPKSSASAEQSCDIGKPFPQINRPRAICANPTSESPRHPVEDRYDETDAIAGQVVQHFGSFA